MVFGAFKRGVEEGPRMVANRRLVAALAGLLLSALALAGCRVEEQGRVLRYEKGTYLGKPDTALTETQRNALRQRGYAQRD
jgi:hypothetical protein